METGRENRIQKMKRDYNKITIPESAGERVLAGIKKAERENRRDTMMKMVKNTGISAAAAVLAIAVLTNANPTIASAMENIPVIGAIAKVVTFRTYEDRNENMEAKIKVPHISLDGTENKAVNQSIEEYADKLIAEYEAQLSQGEGENHYAVESSYDVVTDSDQYLCLKITTVQTMASGAESVKIFTIDKSTGQAVTLKELLDGRSATLDAVGDEIKRQMADQMAKDDSVIYFYNSQEEAVKDFQGINGEENFYISQEGQLVIVFDEYQVAPGYMGVVEFAIPESVVSLDGK